MENWEQEIRELHDFFEGYFVGTLPDALDRVEAALAPDFTMAGPDGGESRREEVMAALRSGYNHTDSLGISIEEPQLLVATDTFVIASYIESHELRERSNHRRATVVFRPDPDGPNGLRWLRVHECWIGPTS